MRDQSREPFPLFVLVFIYNSFPLLIIYLHIDLWQVSEIFITGMFFLCLLVILQDGNRDRFYCCGEDNQKQNFVIAKVLSGLVNRFKNCLTILYGIYVRFCQYNNKERCMPFLQWSVYWVWNCKQTNEGKHFITRKLFLVVVMGGFQLPF